MKGQYKKLHKRGISLLMAAVCAGALMSGCGQVEEEETMSDVIPVLVQKPESGALTLQNEFMGTVTPEESVYVISMVTAEVVSTNVSVGDIVYAGDVLCQLDSEAAELQLASAQVQYNSAALGANSAQLGYEMAQSQYEGTVAQLDAQVGGQKDLQMYQQQIQIDSIKSGIDDINAQKSELDKQKTDLQGQKDKLLEAVKQANSYRDQAQTAYFAAQAKVAYLEPADYQKKQEVLNYYKQLYPESVTGNSIGYMDAYEYDLQIAKQDLEKAKTLYDQASEAASQASAAYAQLEAGISSIDQGQGQLNDALEDANKGLEQTQAIMNITEQEIYEDTQKVIDANKQTAELSLNSAAASVSSAQLGIEGAQLAIDSAEYQLDMYTLKAPISGVIEAVNVKEHDFATPSTPAYIISNKNTMTVTFYVSEGIRNTLSVGQQVSADRNGKLYDAVITEIGSMIDQTTGLFAIKACISLPDESLLTGCSVKITADTYSQDKVLLIPYDAVYYDGSQPYVYVAVNNVVERRNIETGIFDEQTITVLSGLTVEDQLITSWSANLREGALVSIQSQGSAANGAAASEE